jgi:hypothetical protein
MNLAWAIRRLSAMSGREVAYRIGQRARNGLDRFDGAASPSIIEGQATGEPWVKPLPRGFDAKKYAAAADRILSGDFQIFALRPAHLGFPPQWNRDPKTGTIAPLTRSTQIDYRDEALVGDIKYLWEPSRHAALVTLAQAWHLTGDRKFAAGCQLLLDSWFEQCPYRVGPHWTSSLELALRLVNWSFAWHLLGGAQSAVFHGAAGEAFRARWLTSIYQHCRFISRHLSRHSSANNHLLGELTGLFVASVTWPLWTSSERWRDSAHRELEREALEQNRADGVNAEQAIWYHHEVADMLIVAGLVGRANGRDFGHNYWQRLEAMLAFLASIMDVSGNVPNFGDADDAVIAPLDPHEDHVYRSLLARGAVLFGGPEFQLKAGAFDDKSRWLLGDAAEGSYVRNAGDAARLPVQQRFDHGGYYVLGDHFDSPREIRIVADAGPLGYLSIAAHGHADALSFTLSAGGHELLIDPGTFAYHTHKHWRDYFRGTIAHNTVRVDLQDQSINAGNFLWLSHARARLVSFEVTPDEQCWIAEHDGYGRLQDRVVHRRELRFVRATGTLTVRDELLCRSEHQLELPWHFAEGCEVGLDARTLIARNGPAVLHMTLPAAARWQLVRGQEDPPLGWISRAFDSKQPTTTLLGALAIRGPTTLVTELRVDLATARDALSARPRASVHSARTWA